MNQAQLTGERMCRQDKCWSPVPLWRIENEIAAALRSDMSADRLIERALAAAGRPLSYVELKQAYPHCATTALIDALRKVVKGGRVVRTGPPGAYCYAAVRAGDAG